MGSTFSKSHYYTCMYVRRECVQKSYILMYYIHVMYMYVISCVHVEGGDQRQDGCPSARHLFEPNYVKVWTQKFGQRLSMACGVDFVLFKPLYVKIAFIAMFLIFRDMSHSKLSAKMASEDCMLFLFKSQFLSMAKCWVYLISTGNSTLCKV